MKLPKLYPRDLVRVEWVDSHAQMGWQEADREFDLLEIESFGMVVAVTAGSLTITTSWGDNGDVMDPLTIPVVAITSCKKLDHG